MTPTELGILAMAVPMLALVIHIYLQKRGTRRLRDFRRTLDTVLLPRESAFRRCLWKKSSPPRALPQTETGQAFREEWRNSPSRRTRNIF